VLGGVAFACAYYKLHVFIFLVLYLKGTAVGRDHFHFQFAVRTIQFRVGGMVYEGVPVPDILTDILENVRKISGQAAGNLSGS
jgi:hypothetical protein